ncbi:MAG: hypothetical protein GY725_10155 [bacterium]|nr:hypothetical protein [bacterium]
MATEKRNHRLELDRVLGGIVDSIMEAPEAEIEEDLRAAGDDPEATADRLRAKLANTVERHRSHRRTRATARMQQHVFLMNVQPWEFPETEKQRMQLLGAAIRRRPELEEMLQAKLRDLRTLSDEEVKDCLRQLAEMGELEEVPEDGE